jgi:hypothetical protein
MVFEGVAQGSRRAAIDVLNVRKIPQTQHKIKGLADLVCTL